MKLLFENWRKLLKEGEVIQLPRQPRISEDDLQFIIQIEDQIVQRLAALHNNMASIPVEDIEKLEQIVNSIEGLLRK